MLASLEPASTILWLLTLSVVLSAPIDVWFGLAPFCPKNQLEVCELYGLRYVKSDPVGSGYTCLKGEKVLCRTTDLSVPLHRTDLMQIRVVTYNVMETTFNSGRTGQVERTCRIPRALLSAVNDADVIVFNDLFMQGCLNVDEADRKLTISNLLEVYGFPHTFSMGEEGQTLFNEKGGIMIASKWPLFATQELTFRSNGEKDPFIQRGAIYAMVIKNVSAEIVYHIVATQLKSGDGNQETRVKQAIEVHNFISELDIPAREMVIVAGGFNCDRESSPAHCNEVMDSMGVVVPDITGTLTATVDPYLNKMVDKERTDAEWLDYAVYSKRHKAPARSSMEAIDLKADKPFKYCSYVISTATASQPYQVSARDSECEVIKDTSDLSDHFPVSAIFIT